MIELLLVGAFLLVLGVCVYLNARYAIKAAIAQKDLENAIKGIADIEHAQDVREAVNSEPIDIVAERMRRKVHNKNGGVL